MATESQRFLSVPLVVEFDPDTGAYFLHTKTQGVADGVAQPVSINSGLAILETGLTELIGTDEQVDQNEYGADVSVALGATISGHIEQVTFVSAEAGTGAVQTPTGKLYVFDVDPATSVGDTTLTLAARQAQIGVVQVYTTDWVSDANGGSATVQCSVPFHALATLFFVFRNEGPSINDAAGDEETINFNAWISQESRV